MRRIGILGICLLLTANRICAQTKVFELGLVQKFINNNERKTTYNVTAYFNKFKGDPKEPNFLYTFNLPKSTEEKPRIPKVIVGIIPSFEANLGSDVKSAPNNITSSLTVSFIDANLDRVNAPLFVDVAPVIVTDKDFNTGLLYANVSPGKYWYISNDRSHSRHLFTPLARVGLHSGNRFVKGTDTGEIDGWFNRIAPNAYFDYTLQSLKHDTAGAETIRNILTFKVDAKYYLIYGDDYLASNKQYPNITTSLSVTLPIFQKESKGEIRLSAKYFYGYEEPLYQKLSTLTYGLGYFVTF